MATRKHPNDDKHEPKKATDKTAATTAPKADARKPHDDKPAAKADKARRDTAADAFKNEKAHEPPPRHQS
jgi:hypothetical protein